MSKLYLPFNPEFEIRSSKFCFLALFLLSAIGCSAQCTASFSFTPLNAHTRQFNHITGIGEDSTTTYRWTFGDGDSSNLESPLHTYTDTGAFNVCLRIYTPSTHCTSDSCRLMRIDTCNAYYTYVYSPSLTQPEQDIYSFTDGSAGEDTSVTFLWDFGIGDYSTNKNTGLTYEPDDSGTKQVCLTIHNRDNGCTSKFCRTISVDNLCIAGSYNYTLVGRTATFKASVCGHWSNINWDFGDGASASQSDSVVHTYAAGTDSFYICIHVIIDTVCQRLFRCKAIYCGEVYLNYNAINEPAAEQDEINIFPNPTSGVIKITGANLQGPLEINLFDVTGREVKKITAGASQNRPQMDVAGLQPGIYFLRIVSDAGQALKKVVVE